MTYFVVGPSGVGKTSFANTIYENYGIPIYDTGPIIRNIYRKLNIEDTFSDWIRKNGENFGPSFDISLICNYIKNSFNPDFSSIIIGNRSIEGIKYIVEYFKLTSYIIIYLDASFDCLKSNYEIREKKNMTNNEFQLKIEGEKKMGLHHLKDYVLENLDNNCFYYFKIKNEDLNYDKIFLEIKKIVSYNRIR